MKAGVKLALVSDDARSVTLLVRATLPTGDALKGLGTDHASIDPAFLYRHDVGDRVSVESQFGVWHPLDGSRGPFASDGKFAGDIIYYGIGPSLDAVRTGKVRFSPVVELVGWHVVNGFERGRSSRRSPATPRASTSSTPGSARARRSRTADRSTSGAAGR